MSASLVGSEMCIRDRAHAEFRGQGNSANEARVALEALFASCFEEFKSLQRSQEQAAIVLENLNTEITYIRQELQNHDLRINTFEVKPAGVRSVRAAGAPNPVGSPSVCGPGGLWGGMVLRVLAPRLGSVEQWNLARARVFGRRGPEPAERAQRRRRVRVCGRRRGRRSSIAARGPLARRLGGGELGPSLGRLVIRSGRPWGYSVDLDCAEKQLEPISEVKQREAASLVAGFNIAQVSGAIYTAVQRTVSDRLRMTKPEMAGDGLGLELRRLLVCKHEASEQPVVQREFQKRWAYPKRCRDASGIRICLPEWEVKDCEHE
eukprot:9153166-Alexandrium_andersonii.AAC.1